MARSWQSEYKVRKATLPFSFRGEEIRASTELPHLKSNISWGSWPQCSLTPNTSNLLKNATLSITFCRSEGTRQMPIYLWTNCDKKLPLVTVPKGTLRFESLWKELRATNNDDCGPLVQLRSARCFGKVHCITSWSRFVFRILPMSSSAFRF